MADSTHCISPAGILDSDQGNLLRHQVVEALEQGSTAIEIDMNAVTFMDSAGFGTLVTALKQVNAAGGRLQLTNVNSQVRLVLEITGTEGLFMLPEQKNQKP